MKPQDVSLTDSDCTTLHDEGPAPEVSVVMPCLNEAATVGRCVTVAHEALAAHGIDGEVIVADNGSADGSTAVALGAGARVVRVAEKGYGSALLGGIAAARGRYVVMGDADGSYDFAELGPFVDKLRRGCELVMGNRFAGGIVPGAMPPLHRYLGNPLLSGIGRLLFHAPCGDFHCGLRAFDKAAIDGLGLAAPGMELASEMVVKATLAGLRMAEVPTTLRPDGRGGRPPHLHSFRDGWRHLRLMLRLGARQQASRIASLGRRRPAPVDCAVDGERVAAGARAAGFTLLELLVVCGIITVLLALLLPAAARARRQSNSVVCLSNLRQLHHAYQAYALDNRGRGITFAAPENRSWLHAFRSSNPAVEKVSFCPEADEPSEAGFGGPALAWTFDAQEPETAGPAAPAGRNGAGTAGAPKTVRYHGSYGFNGWLFRWDQAGRGGQSFSGGHVQHYLPLAAGGASLVPVFADAAWLDGWPRSVDPTPLDLRDGDRTRQGPGVAPRENMMARFTIARHDRAINIAFLDGHGETVDLGRLKRLRWHEGFVYGDWTPPLPRR